MILVPTPTGLAVDVDAIRDQQTMVADTVRRLAGDTWEVSVVAGGARGATRNALIARAQANRRRDPFYLSDRSWPLVKSLAMGMVGKVVSIKQAAAKQIAERLMINVLENVESQRNREGDTFSPLTPGYAQRKQRKFGFTKPILKATGDLLGGLRTRIQRFTQ